MTEKTRQDILNWIYSNHEHHEGAKNTSINLETLEITENESESACHDGDYPYVNSLELEKFIKEL